MVAVSSALLKLAEWVIDTLLAIAKQIRDGKYTEEYLISVKPALQAIREGKKFQVVFPESATLAPDIADQLAAWERFYLDQFGLTCDFSGLSIPKQRKGFNWLIVVAEGLTIEQVFQQCKKHFPCWKYTNRDLDTAVPTNDRNPQNGSYAIWVRDRVEADQEHKNHSARYLEQKHIPGITLLERLLLELKYFLETGKHLDIQNVTLCSGSRYDVGAVPIVHWDFDRLRVYWYFPDDARGRLRSREVVS